MEPSSPGSQLREEEFPKRSLTVKIRIDSGCLGEIEGDGNPRYPFKGPMHKLSRPQTLTLSARGRTEAREVQGSYGERLHYIEPREGLEG